MTYTIENKHITASIKSLGAELTSLKSKETEIEYIWNGDKEYWGRHAPVLFPIVGQVKDKTYFVEGKKYELPQHGFARDTEFKVVNQQTNQITFELVFSEKTLKIYPYKFALRVSYKVEANELTTVYEVINKDSKNISYSIGGHPAFNCPITKDELFEDYTLEFDHHEEPKQIHLNTLTGLRNGKITQENIGKSIPLNYGLFKNDAVIYTNLKSKKVTLKSNKSTFKVIFDFEQWDYLAFWTKKKGTPFVCIEPWLGITDADNSDQHFHSKLGIQELKVNSTKITEYKIKVS